MSLHVNSFITVAYVIRMTFNIVHAFAVPSWTILVRACQRYAVYRMPSKFNPVIYPKAFSYHPSTFRAKPSCSDFLSKQADKGEIKTSLEELKSFNLITRALRCRMHECISSNDFGWQSRKLATFGDSVMHGNVEFMHKTSLIFPRILLCKEMPVFIRASLVAVSHWIFIKCKTLTICKTILKYACPLGTWVLTLKVLNFWTFT